MSTLIGTVLLSGAVMAQTVEAPTPRVGEVREYQTIDEWTNQVRLEERFEVIGVVSDFTRMRMETQALNPRTNSMDRRGPEDVTVRSDLNIDYTTRSGTARRVNFSWPLTVGKKWSYDYAMEFAEANGQRSPAFYKVSAEVNGWESVATPAGTFKALKITHKGTVESPSTPGVARVVWTGWYAPELGAEVKLNFQFDSAAGVPGVRSQSILTAYKKAK